MRSEIVRYSTIIVLIIFLGVIFIVLPHGNSYAQMIAVGDEELSEISAQSGISIYTSGSARITYDTINWSDTETPKNWIEFKNIVIDDGAGGPFLFSTSGDPIFIDVGHDTSTGTVYGFQDTTHRNPRYYSVGSLIFCNQDLGSLDIDAVTQFPSTLIVSSHASSGIDYEYATKLDIDEFRYTYNTSGSAFRVSGIHSVYDASAGGGTVENPGSWDLSDVDTVGRFYVGNMGAGNPATIDVVTENGNDTSLLLNLPMEGSIRMEKVEMGANDFGPCAIDGLNVHHMYLKLDP